MKSDYKEAYDEGWKAYEANQPCAPLKSPWLSDRYPVNKPGWKRAFSAWTAGWQGACAMALMDIEGLAKSIADVDKDQPVE